jgi:hypothetical protein
MCIGKFVYRRRWLIVGVAPFIRSFYVIRFITKTRKDVRMRPTLAPMLTKDLTRVVSLYIGILLFQFTLLQLQVQAQELGQASASAQSSASAPEIPLYPSRALRDMTLVAQAAGEQAQWLETDYGDILVFYRPTEAQKTRGTLVIFHAAEDPQTWPPILENLRANLPRYGWETLGVSLPQQSPAAVPARASASSASSTAINPAENEASIPDSTNPDSTNPDSANPDSTNPASTTEAAPPTLSASSSLATSSATASSAVARDTLIRAYVDAAFRFLQKKGQLNVVVLVDNSSAVAVLAQLLPKLTEKTGDQTTIDGPIQALVIANMQNQEPLESSELSAIFTAPNLPVMDVFFRPETPHLVQIRDLHRAVAMRQKLDDYQQALLDDQPKMVESDPRSFLAARIRGFMQRHANGTEEKGTGPNREGNQNPP